MNTTTSEPEGTGPSDTQRRNAVIASETTAEIPVHLLFRDDNGPLAPPPALRPAVVSRWQGTGEQPRIGPTAAPPAAAASAGSAPADPALIERPAPVLPGWTGLVAGACSLAGIGALVWGTGAVPDMVAALFRVTPPPYHGIGIGLWCLLALGVLLALFGLGGLGRGTVGHAWVLTLCGDYHGSVRRTGLVWMSPLVLRRRVDVRLRHWRSKPMPVHDAEGTALRVVVLVVWRVRDTARAVLGVEDHEAYLGEQVEAATARVFSQLPADGPSVFDGGTPVGESPPTLRDAEAVGATLTKTLAAECAAAGIEIFTAQPTALDYAPEVAEAMQLRRLAALDARHRDSVLTSVVDAVDDTVSRLTDRGLIEPDDYERKALVKDLTVAFYTGRAGGADTGNRSS
ncbi:SPFH domain-containing protein [Streptomyces sp. NPDC018833]|uniref:SPFH domain-containing protein n=1 Tax=Streptomyces sp. NPDC018833 TaxID=3365053 RepID=UPI0037995E57